MTESTAFGGNCFHSMQEVAHVVKGVSRQVVVVKSTDAELFDQAIFLIRDGAVPAQGITETDILREANAAAAACLQPKKRTQLRARSLCALGGAGITGALWLLSILL